jgi:predicted dienelactone hydrolase
MLLFIALFACHAPPDTAVPDDTTPTEEPFLPPNEEGPWIAGTYEEVAPEGTIELTVQVWFPASEAGDDPYTYDGFFEASAREDGVPDCAAPRPVMVFSHGNKGIRYQSVYLTEWLARRGWVVVAPDHLYNTFLDYDEERLAEVLFRRPADVAAAFDWLAGTAAGPGGPLEGCVAPEAGYAVAGHSFGGFTAVAVAGAAIVPAVTATWCAQWGGWMCEEVAAWAADHPGEEAALGDARAWATVAMAPAGYEALKGGLDRVAVPALVLGGSRDDVTPMSWQVTPIFGGLASLPRYLGEIADAGHHTFSDACDLVGTFDDCDPPYLDPHEAHPLIDTVTAAFLGVAQGDARFHAWLPPKDDRLIWTAVEE